jgi:hypothetical protein
VVGSTGECIGYGVEPVFPVGEVEVKLVKLLLPPVMARLHKLQSERVEERSVVSTDCDRGSK